MRLGLSNSRVVFTPSTSMIADKEKKHYKINIFFENYNYAKFHHSLVSRNLSNATILTKLREYHQSPCLSISRNHSFIVSLINNPGGNRLGTSRVTVRSQVSAHLPRLFAIRNVLNVAPRRFHPRGEESSRCVETSEQQMRDTNAGIDLKIFANRCCSYTTPPSTIPPPIAEPAALIDAVTNTWNLLRMLDTARSS